jgi:hypothetical protein
LLDLPESPEAAAQLIKQAQGAFWEHAEAAYIRLYSFWDRVGQVLDFAFFNIRKFDQNGFMHPCVPVMGQLQKEIAFVAAALRCKRVWIIIESSQRADEIVQACFSQLRPIDGSPSLPLVKSLMPKIANEPGLEIADFIVSAAGSEVQHRLRGKAGHAADFADVFCRLPALGCRYREVSHVAVDENGLVSVTGVALVP